MTWPEVAVILIVGLTVGHVFGGPWIVIHRHYKTYKQRGER